MLVSMQFHHLTLLVLLLGIVAIPENETSETTKENGTTTTMKENGTTTTMKENGTTTTMKENGTTTMMKENGTTTTMKENGTATTMKDNGTTTTMKENGTATTMKENGTTTTMKENGTATTMKENGTATTVKENGTATTMKENGTATTMKENGTTTTMKENGTTTTMKENGTTTTMKVNETTTTKPENSINPTKSITPVQFQIESADARLTFSISLMGTFDSNLKIKSSVQYKNYTNILLNQLSKSYDGTPGYKRIEIIGFNEGSIIVSYDVVADAQQVQKNMTKFIEHIRRSVIPSLGRICVTNNTSCANPTLLNQTMERRLDNVSSALRENGVCALVKEPCPIGYVCIGNVSDGVAFCHDKCALRPNYCKPNEQCYVDYRTNDMMCRCIDTEAYYFFGPNCELKSLKVSEVNTVERIQSELSAKEYGIMVGSTAGAVAVIIIVVLIVRCLRKRNKRGKKDKINIDDSDDQASLPMTHMDVKLQDESAFDNTGYINDSGIPEISRHQRVFRDPQTGEEAVIYQPTIITRPMSRGSRELQPVQAEHISRNPLYEYMDSEEIYKIKRPNLRTSRTWQH